MYDELDDCLWELRWLGLMLVSFWMRLRWDEMGWDDNCFEGHEFNMVVMLWVLSHKLISMLFVFSSHEARL